VTDLVVQIYRKTALKIVQDLGEDVLPERAALQEEQKADKNPEATLATESAPSLGHSEPENPEPKVTTEARKPLKVPETVHIKITPENLKDYVGPPIYHKDRMYVYAPPPGVSTGLGYLGNGSGAVMPVEASVRCLIIFYTLTAH
jgi:ATP-dependent Lon protease